MGSEYCVVCAGITGLGLTKISLCAPTMPHGSLILNDQEYKLIYFNWLYAKEYIL